MLDEHVVAVVLEHLDTRECCTVALTCRAWRRASQAEYLWQRHLERDWCERAAPGLNSAVERWRSMFASFGRYYSVYREAWLWWDTVLGFFRERLPAVAESVVSSLSWRTLARLPTSLTPSPGGSATVHPTRHLIGPRRFWVPSCTDSGATAGC